MLDDVGPEMDTTGGKQAVTSTLHACYEAEDAITFQISRFFYSSNGWPRLLLEQIIIRSHPYPILASAFQESVTFSFSVW